MNDTILRPQVIEAPIREFEPREHSLFLGGGITDCPDWQSDMISELRDISNLTIFNPRRANFPMNDRSAAREQITWEFDHLKKASAIVIWFCRETENPIVLYELGIWVNGRPEIPAFIGIDPGYIRTDDVIIQTELARPELVIVNSFDKLCGQVKQYLSEA